MSNQIINYSQCWEDPALLYQALVINSEDVVLSIMSGGDNSLALLLQKPEKVIAIDSNPAQKYLFELKVAAIKSLSYEEILLFTGAKKCSCREVFLDKVKKSLSQEAISWWGENLPAIKNGVIHSGRFEYFLKFFRCYILPLIHPKKTVVEFLNTQSLQSQRDFYANVWNSKRWRLLFRLITSRFVLKSFARQRGMFSHAGPKAIAEKYMQRLDRNFKGVPFKDNYFINYCLLGDYGQSLPPYLEKEGVVFLKDNMSRLSMVVDNLTNYLKSMPDNYFSKFNLSDVFEPLSLEQNDLLWQEIIRTAKNSARVAYWNNLVPRTFPEQFSANTKDESVLANELFLKDRVFFYGSFHLNTIIK